MSDAEKKATEHANKRCLEQGPEFIVWCMCRDDFLAGYAEGRKAFTSEVSEIMERAYAKTGKYFSEDILDLLYDELSLKGEK